MLEIRNEVRLPYTLFETVEIGEFFIDSQENLYLKTKTLFDENEGLEYNAILLTDSNSLSIGDKEVKHTFFFDDYICYVVDITMSIKRPEWY